MGRGVGDNWQNFPPFQLSIDFGNTIMTISTELLGNNGFLIQELHYLSVILHGG
jgi:hypothetical protein